MCHPGNGSRSWLALWAALATIAVSAPLARADTYSCTLHSGSYRIVTLPDGTQQIEMKGFGQLLIPGKPKLPSRVFCLAVPPDARVRAVQVVGEQPIELPGRYNITPAPCTATTSGNPEEDARLKATYWSNRYATYSSDAPYPCREGDLIAQGGYRRYNVVDVRFSPFCYRPKTGSLRLYRSARVVVTFDPDPNRGRSLGRWKAENKPTLTQRARKLIHNYEEAEAWYTLPEAGSAAPDTEIYDYLIIHDTFMPVSALDHLVGWEIGKGRRVRLETVQSIESHYSGRDTQEKIRNFLREKLHEWGISDVLIVGRLATVPMRECTVHGDDGSTRKYPTDYYYAELSSSDADSWDSDGDGQYGERGQDNVDLTTEVHVGRIPSDNSNLVRRVCAKSADYEYSADMAYKKNVLLAAAFADENTDFAVLTEKVRSEVLSTWDCTSYRLYEGGPHWFTIYMHEADLNRDNFVNAWKTHNFGYALLNGHGSPFGICYDAHYSGADFVNSSDASDMGPDHPSIVLGSACSTAYPEFDDNLGRSLLVDGKAAAYVGSVRESYYAVGWDELSDGWNSTFAYLFSRLLIQNAENVGTALFHASREMCTTYGWDTDWYAVFEWVLYGNPDMIVDDRPPDLPNLAVFLPAGWTYPLVPRNTPDANTTWCPVPASLTAGNTYLNFSWKNTGGNPVYKYDTGVYLDGLELTVFGMQNMVPGAEAFVNNAAPGGSPVAVSGGRHTLYYVTDVAGIARESSESDNAYGRQFVWSPLVLSNDSPIERSAPPIKDAYGPVTVGAYYNNDGFAFAVQGEKYTGWWAAVAALPRLSSSDYDVKLWDVGSYTGSEQGFGPGELRYSSYDLDRSDFVMVNQRVAANGTYYAGVINENSGTAAYRIEKAVSRPIGVRPGTMWNGPYTASADNVLDLYEVYLEPGSYVFNLDQTAGVCDLGMSLYQADGSFFRKGEFVPNAMSNVSGDGGDEGFEVTASQAGYYGLAVWKVDSSDYPKTCTYRISCGPPAIYVVSPCGGESWTVGQQQYVIWTSDAGAGSAVKIEISRDGGSSWSTLAASVPNTGGYNWHPWTVTAPTSTQCRIRITSTTNASYTDTSDADFTIKYLTIAGRVTDPGGAGVSGVTMNGLPGNPVTNASGSYSAGVPYEWCGTVKPSKTGWTISPASRTYAYIDYECLNENWTAAACLTDTGASLTGVDLASLAWGDCDGDSDLDLVVCGYTSSGPMTRLYRNDGTGTFSEMATSLTNISHGGIAWGDYDRDGDLDIALAGYAGSVKVARVFRNDGGTFTDIGAALTGVWQGSVAWGDCDNDGDLDLAVAGDTGSGYTCKVYRNDGGGVFTALAASFTGVFLSAMAWGDYDNDGDLDLVVAGNTGSGRSTTLYRNDGGGVFNAVTTSLAGVDAPGLAWGDYDNDGDLDLALAGNTGTRITRVYRNDGGGTFVDIGASMTGVNAASVGWGDYDNDGDLDLAVSGYYVGTNSGLFKLYRNDGGTFVDASPPIPGLQYCSLSWGDCDGDGDLDLAMAGIETAGVYRARIYRNNASTPNTSPGAPSWLAATVSGTQITFRWLAGSDAETPTAGLSYNLRVGTAPGLNDVFSGMANASTGMRLLPATGNAQTRLSWTLKNISPGTYYWSVQAIDSAYAASPWAPTSASGSVFTDSGISLTGVSDGAIAWGDCDNDDDLDLAVMGYTGSAGSAIIYKNNAGSFSNSGVSLPQLFYGSLAWGDYNRDGLLDLEISGYTGSARSSKLYRNTGSNLVDSGVTLDGVNLSSTAWVDWENDGDLDLSLAGSTGTGRLTSVYRNNGNGTFSFSGVGFPMLSECAIAWTDYDSDGDLDVALAGDTGSGYITHVYRRNAGGTYSLVAALTGVYQCSLAWGDYDNDGDFDLVVAGNTGSVHSTKLYRNDAGTLVDSGAILQGVSSCSAAWGDFDNDGDLDLALAGWTGASRASKVYRNDGGGAFTDTGAALIGVSQCSLAWGDYDRDGDLDLALSGFTASGRVTKIYRNQCLTPNTAPTAPGGLVDIVGGSELTLTWTASSDGQTPPEGLTYNVRVGTSSQGDDIFCSMAGPSSGVRRIPAAGNAHKKLSWTLTGIPAGDYWWSVQAVDPSHAGSLWAVARRAYVVPSSSVSQAKLTADSKPARCEGMVVTAASANWFYIESDDRCCGIRVERASHGLAKGMRANVYGILRTNQDGERYIEASGASQNGTGTVRPLGLTNLSLGGGRWNYSELGGMGQLGVTGGVGMNNIGLLVRIWGIVTHSEPGLFYVDDGSGVNDGSGHPGVRVIGAVPVTPVEEPVGCTVGVTGISSCFRTPSGDIARAVLTRGPEDVQKLRVP